MVAQKAVFKQFYTRYEHFNNLKLLHWLPMSFKQTQIHTIQRTTDVTSIVLLSHVVIASIVTSIVSLSTVRRG